jgi:hypothetical protein
MTKAYDLDALVDLLSKMSATTDDDVDTLVPVARRLSLREAVRVVMEDWDDHKLRKVSAVILRDAEPAIQSLDEINSIYQQAKANRPT